MFDFFPAAILYTNNRHHHHHPPKKKTGLKSTKQKKRDQNWEVELQDFVFDDYASFPTLKEM